LLMNNHRQERILVVALSIFDTLNVNIANTEYAVSTTISIYAKGVVVSATIYL